MRRTSSFKRSSMDELDGEEVAVDEDVDDDDDGDAPAADKSLSRMRVGQCETSLDQANLVRVTSDRRCRGVGGGGRSPKDR